MTVVIVSAYGRFHNNNNNNNNNSVANDDYLNDVMTKCRFTCRMLLITFSNPRSDASTLLWKLSEALVVVNWLLLYLLNLLLY
jgi:hypothetical protein